MHIFFLRFMNFHLALMGFSYCSCTSKLHTFSSKWFHFKIHVHAKGIKNPFPPFFAKTFIARAKTSIEWKADHSGTWRGPTALVDEKCFNTIKCSTVHQRLTFFSHKLWPPPCSVTARKIWLNLHFSTKWDLLLHNACQMKLQNLALQC